MLDSKRAHLLARSVDHLLEATGQGLDRHVADEAEGDTIQIKPLKDDRDQEIVALDRVAERIASLLDA